MRSRTEAAWRLKFVHTVRGRRRASYKWTNRQFEAPGILRDYQPGGPYFDEMPPTPPMTPDFFNEFVFEEEEEERRRRDLITGVVTSGGGGTCRNLFAGEGSSRVGEGGVGDEPNVVFARTDDEEAAAIAEARAVSAAKKAEEDEKKRQEEAAAIAQVKELIAKEAAAKPAAAPANWIYLD